MCDSHGFLLSLRGFAPNKMLLLPGGSGQSDFATTGKFEHEMRDSIWYDVKLSFAFGGSSPSITFNINGRELGTGSINGVQNSGLQIGIYVWGTPDIDCFIKDIYVGSPPPPGSTTQPSSSPSPTTPPSPTFAPPTAAPGPCVNRYGQCGGVGHTGSTVCCEGTCTVQNEYYHQCI
jgi:hypothetical protein